MAENMSYQQVTPEVIISANLMNKIGIAPDESAGYTVVDKVVLLHKERMTRLDRLRLAERLITFAFEELIGSIEKECGGCEGCMENCPYQMAATGEDVSVCAGLREMARIPQDAPLYPAIGKDGTIVIRSAKKVPCIQSIPQMVKDYMADAVCWGTLAELIEKEATCNGG